MHGASHPLRRGTKLYDAMDFIGSLVAALMLTCGGAAVCGYASAFAGFIGSVGP